MWWKNNARLETDKERLLLCYQVNRQIVSGRFPLSRELALELAALMAQLDMGDCGTLPPTKASTLGNNQGSNRSPKTNGASPTPLHSSTNTLNNIQGHSNLALNAIDKFYPYRYRDQLNQEGLAELQVKLMDKWRGLRGRTQLDCVRIYLTCTRKWPFFGATLFQVSFF